MIPGMNPRQMRQVMKRLGIQQQEIEATEVIIRTPEKEIIITEPSVAKINMMGQETYQITGNAHERLLSTEPEITEEDIKTIMEQTNVDEETARKTLKETKGDLAEAIMKLQEE